MVAPERVLADTSALYAIVVLEDRFHERAVQAFQQLIDENKEAWVTS